MMSAAKMQREKAVRGAEVTQTRLLPDTASVSHLHSLVRGSLPGARMETSLSTSNAASPSSLPGCRLLEDPGQFCLSQHSLCL